MTNVHTHACICARTQAHSCVCAEGGHIPPSSLDFDKRGDWRRSLKESQKESQEEPQWKSSRGSVCWRAWTSSSGWQWSDPSVFTSHHCVYWSVWTRTEPGEVLNPSAQHAVLTPQLTRHLGGWRGRTPWRVCAACCWCWTCSSGWGPDYWSLIHLEQTGLSETCSCSLW